MYYYQYLSSFVLVVVRFVRKCNPSISDNPAIYKILQLLQNALHQLFALWQKALPQQRLLSPRLTVCFGNEPHKKKLVSCKG